MEEYRDSIIGFIFNEVKEVKKSVSELNDKVEERFSKLNDKLEELISIRERVDILSTEQEKICNQIVDIEKEKHNDVKKIVSDDKRFRRDLWLVGLAAIGSLFIQILTLLSKR